MEVAIWKNILMIIAGIHANHNAGVTLIDRGHIIFSTEEERMSRIKRDSSPFLTIGKIRYEYMPIDTQLSFAAISGFTPINNPTGNAIDPWTGENIYVSYLKKLKLISHNYQVVDFGNLHHLLHAATAFYRSEFENSIAIVVDGSGSPRDGLQNIEAESIYECSYPNSFKPLYKRTMSEGDTSFTKENDCIYFNSPAPGIGAMYDMIGCICGFKILDCGKTMGLAAYGKQDSVLSSLIKYENDYPVGDYNIIDFTPRENHLGYFNFKKDSYLLGKTKENLSYAIQEQSEQAVLHLINKAKKLSNSKNIVLSGGFFQNCKANYRIAKENPDYNIYVEPLCYDGGLSLGAALLQFHIVTPNGRIKNIKEKIKIT